MTLPVAAEALGELGAAEGAASGAGKAVAVRSAAGRTSITQRTGVKPTRPRPAQTRVVQSRRTRTAYEQASTAKGVAIGSALSGRGRRGTPPARSGGSGGGSGGGSAGKGSGAHRWVIAEFIACVVIVGASPILTRPPGKSGHLYVANDFLRLTAVCLLFFILALMANNARTARFAAAFGGLVTLGAVVNANKALIAIAEIFNPRGGKS
jgi:hypothetical protein